MENRIRELRKAKGLTLLDLAELVNSSNQQISQLETGRRCLNVDWLERLSDALGCHPMELLYGKAMAKTEQEEAFFLIVPKAGSICGKASTVNKHSACSKFASRAPGLSCSAACLQSSARPF